MKTTRKMTNKSDSLYIPKSAVLELTYLCNHRCLFCSCPWEDTTGAEQYDRGAELSTEQWKQALSVLEAHGVEQVSISGGEALMKEGLVDLLQYIRKNTNLNADSEIVLISNARLMDEVFLSAFKKYRVHLSLSLPGLETFEKLTGVDNADGVLYWLNRAHEEGIETTCNVIVTKLNHFELYETLANGLLAGADTLLVNRFLAGGRGIANSDILSINNKELNETLDIAEGVLTKANRLGSIGTEIPLCVIEKGENHYKKLTVGSICAAGKEFFVIDPSGLIRVCNHSPHIVGHIFDNEFVTDRGYWNRFVYRGYIPVSCTMCEDVSYCDCGCRETASIVYGSLSEKDPCMMEKET